MTLQEQIEHESAVERKRLLSNYVALLKEADPNSKRVADAAAKLGFSAAQAELHRAVMTEAARLEHGLSNMRTMEAELPAAQEALSKAMAKLEAAQKAYADAEFQVINLQHRIEREGRNAEVLDTLKHTFAPLFGVAEWPLAVWQYRSITLPDVVQQTAIRAGLLDPTSRRNLAEQIALCPVPEPNGSGFEVVPVI